MELEELMLLEQAYEDWKKETGCHNTTFFSVMMFMEEFSEENGEEDPFNKIIIKINGGKDE